jgi:hypothetical protein
MWMWIEFFRACSVKKQINVYQIVKRENLSSSILTEDMGKIQKILFLIVTEVSNL